MSDGISEEEKVQNIARHWVQTRWDQVADQLNETHVRRINGQALTKERLEELHEGLEEDGIHANKGLVKYSVRRSGDEMVQEFDDDLSDFYDEFKEVVTNFTENLYEKVGDGQKTINLLEEITRKIETGNKIRLEYSRVEGFEQFHEYLNRERQEISRIKAASPPSIEEVRENHYPEVPETAYENFREQFDTEGPLEVSEQSRLFDYAESKSDLFKQQYESLED